MKTVLASSDIFEASSKLQAAATTLQRLLRGDDVCEEDRENLRWCGSFLEELDWRASADNVSEGAAHLSVRATEARPFFYATLRHTRHLFNEAGIGDAEQIQEFLSSTYEFLMAAGEEAKGEDLQHMDLAAAFLGRLSTELLLRLTGNGVPAEKDRPMFTST
jgi:hypothetical protein